MPRRSWIFGESNNEPTAEAPTVRQTVGLEKFHTKKLSRVWSKARPTFRPGVRPRAGRDADTPTTTAYQSERTVRSGNTNATDLSPLKSLTAVRKPIYMRRRSPMCPFDSSGVSRSAFDEGLRRVRAQVPDRPAEPLYPPRCRAPNGRSWIALVFAANASDRVD
jgi:hypothetical protein